MPWYPGADGRCITSYWDGQQWQISLTQGHLILGTDCVALDDIAAVSYWNKSVFALPGATFGPHRPYIHRGFSAIDTVGSSYTIDLGNPMLRNVPENEVAWRGLVDISRRFIEPRIAQRILGVLRAGGEYSVRSRWCCVTLNNRGFTSRLLRTKTYPWSAFGQVSVDPYSNNMSIQPRGNDGKVWVYARPAAGAKLRTVTMLKTGYQCERSRHGPESCADLDVSARLAPQQHPKRCAPSARTPPPESTRLVPQTGH